MGFRKVALLTEIFALTAMSSVGFSSWLAIYSPSIEATGIVNVENITNLNDYMNVNSMIFSEYNTEGFYEDFTSSAAVSKVATLVAEIEVDLNKCQDTFGTFNYLSFGFELSSQTKYFNNNTEYFNPILLSNSRTLTYDCIIGNTKSSNSSNVTYSNSIIYTSILIENITIENITTARKMYIHLKYKLDLTNSFDKFISYVQSNDEKDSNGNVLNVVDDEIKFNLVATLEGGNS